MAKSFSERGGWWVVWQAVFMVLVIVSGPIAKGTNRSWMTVFSGRILIVIGAVFGIAGAVSLGSNRTAFPRPTESCQLVSTGIYSLVRHPLYASLIYLGFGWALVWSSWIDGAAALAMTVFFDAKARREEVWLCEMFTAYPEYMKRVRRFVPSIY
jgi:protein-S-isoprenylcysteine O-methyltransferase Ste14